jgi:hypothetical protein
MNKRYSLHHIHSADEFTFSPEEYSYFKYGDKSYAAKFAKELFDGFISAHDNILDTHKDIVVLPSPYMAIPTASNFLCFYFKKHLDFYLFQKGKKSSILSKINRNHTYTTDYGNLSFEDRKNLIANDTYSLDKDFLRGKLCIFIDDIKITGSHEFTVNKILDEYQVEADFLFMYYAELMNLELDPKIENYFNYYAVKSVEHIAEVMLKPSFQFNTRIVIMVECKNINKDSDFFISHDYTDLLRCLQSISKLPSSSLKTFSNTQLYNRPTSPASPCR